MASYDITIFVITQHIKSHFDCVKSEVGLFNSYNLVGVNVCSGKQLLVLTYLRQLLVMVGGRKNS